MRRRRCPTRVAPIANLIGESGETANQPLPDFLAAPYPTIKYHRLVRRVSAAGSVT